MCLLMFTELNRKPDMDETLNSFTMYLLWVTFVVREIPKTTEDCTRWGNNQERGALSVDEPEGGRPVLPLGEVPAVNEVKSGSRL